MRETFEDYCIKYGIDEEYPMTAPSLIKAMRAAELHARALDVPVLFVDAGRCPYTDDPQEDFAVDGDCEYCDEDDELGMLKSHDRLGKFEDDAEAIYEDLLEVLISKQIDYGPDNINNAPGGAANGILVRMSDKMERLKNLTYHTDADSIPNHESIEDSLLDIANYAVIMMMVRNGVWPASLNG